MTELEIRCGMCGEPQFSVTYKEILEVQTRCMACEANISVTIASGRVANISSAFATGKESTNVKRHKAA